MEIFVIILILVALLVLPNIKVVPQAKAYVVERIGKISHHNQLLQKTM